MCRSVFGFKAEDADRQEEICIGSSSAGDLFDVPTYNTLGGLPAQISYF